MTAEPDLLPLPEWTKRDDLGGLVPSEVRSEMRAYTRANLAPLQAETEALRAERDLFRDETIELVRQNGEWQARAERLAEALRHQRWCRTCAEDGWESCEDGRKADALLNPAAAQENDDA